MGHLGHVLWLMGPTSSGKTTLAQHCVSQWRDMGRVVLHFDGDEVRDFFGDGHGFDPKDRLRVVMTLALLANKVSEAGVMCIVSALTAHDDARAYIAEHIPSLITGYVDCSIEECARRDPKGLYARAREGKIDTLIGWNTPYIPPENPALILNTQCDGLEDLFQQIDAYLNEMELQV